MEQLSLLRSTAQRLIVTPVEDLPRIAGFLSASLSTCTKLSSEQDQKTIDFSGPLHRLKTRLSSLLQGRSSAERLTASVIIKSYVETIRPVEASQWEAWCRGIITCLNKGDPWEAKAVYLSALTRIFILCSQSPTLQREVASPLLPVFLNASLAAVKPTTSQKAGKPKSLQSQLLVPALDCWIELLQHFSQTLRPFAARLKQVAQTLLNEEPVSGALCELAVRLLSSLHICAPKATARADWDQAVANIILATHQSLDVLFRAVTEDWASTSVTLSKRNVQVKFSESVGLTEDDAVGLKSWTGVYEGSDRVVVLMRLLSGTLTTSSHVSTIPIGSILDLTARLIGTTVPNTNNHTKTRSEVSKDEKDELWANLSRLHVQTLSLLTVLCETFGKAILPCSSTICGQMFEIFDAEHWNSSIRMALYSAMAVLLQHDPQVLSRHHASSFQTMLKAACRDLAAATDPIVQSASALAGDQRLTNGASKHSSKSQSRPVRINSQSDLSQSAQQVLRIAYEHVSSSIPHAIRAEMDRTAILVDDAQLLLASTMNPPSQSGTGRKQPSLLPFLMRSQTGRSQPGTEALLRPRLPNLQVDNITQVEVPEINDDDLDAFEHTVAVEHDDTVPENGRAEDHDIYVPAARDITDESPHEPTHTSASLSTQPAAKRKLSQSPAEPGTEALLVEPTAKRPQHTSDKDDVEMVEGDGATANEQVINTFESRADVVQSVKPDATTAMPEVGPTTVYNSRTEVPDSDDDSDMPEIVLGDDDEEEDDDDEEQ